MSRTLLHGTDLGNGLKRGSRAFMSRRHRRLSLPITFPFHSFKPSFTARSSAVKRGPRSLSCLAKLSPRISSRRDCMNLDLHKFLRMKVAMGAAGLLLIAPVAAFAGQTVNGPMAFNPIAGSAYGQMTNTWTQPFIIPEGFSQTKLSVRIPPAPPARTQSALLRGRFSCASITRGGWAGGVRCPGRGGP